jgi:ketosteroid isomerase-like protein
MSVDLPKPIADYFAAENGRDVEAMARCFAESAVAREEGRTIKGSAAIKRWKAETTEKYEHTVEPLAVVRKSGKTIVTGRSPERFPAAQ